MSAFFVLPLRIGNRAVDNDIRADVVFKRHNAVKIHTMKNEIHLVNMNMPGNGGRCRQMDYVVKEK